MGHAAQGWATHGGAEGQREGPAGDSSAPPLRTQLERRKGGWEEQDTQRKRQKEGESWRGDMERDTESKW